MTVSSPRPGQRRRSIWDWAALSALVSGVLLVVLYIAHAPGREAMTFGWIQIAFAVWAVASWRRVTGRYIDLYSLFFIAVFLFHCGQPALEALGLNPPQTSIFRVVYNRGAVATSLLLTTGALMALHLGALIGVALYRRQRTVPSRQAADDRGDPSTDRILRRFGWLVVGLAVVPTVIVLRRCIGVVQGSGYIGLYQQEVATGFPNWRVAAGFLVPGALFLLAGSRGRPLGIICAWLVIGCNALALLYVGTRGKAVQSLIAAAWLHHSVIAPIKKRYVAAAVLAGVLLMVFVGLVRFSIGLGSYRSLAKEALEHGDNPVVPVIQEMGSSLKTVLYTVELVPKERGYDYGLGYAKAMVAPVPNLFWDVHPAIKGGTYCQWLIRTAAPARAEQGAGWGFSMIAEAYLNFCSLGAVVFVLLVGCALGVFVSWVSDRRSPLLFAAEATAMSFLLWWARSESVRVVRPVVWGCILPCFLLCALARAARGNGGSGHAREVLSRARYSKQG